MNYRSHIADKMHNQESVKLTNVCIGFIPSCVEKLHAIINIILTKNPDYV